MKDRAGRDGVLVVGIGLSTLQCRIPTAPPPPARSSAFGHITELGNNHYRFTGNDVGADVLWDA